MTAPPQIEITEVSDISHVNLIRNSWLKSYKRGPHSKHVPSKIYYQEEGEIIGKLLLSGEIHIIVNKKDPDQILGWLCGQILNDVKVLHYIYIKAPFRGLGLGFYALNKIFPNWGTESLIHTYMRPDFHKAFSRKGVTIYNPYLKEKLT